VFIYNQPHWDLSTALYRHIVTGRTRSLELNECRPLKKELYSDDPAGSNGEPVTWCGVTVADSPLPTDISETKKTS